MSMGGLNRILKTRQDVLECRHVNEHSRASSLHQCGCCFRSNTSLLARRANLSYDEDEGRGPSTASAAFLEEVSTISCLGYGFRLHSLTLGLLNSFKAHSHRA